jgi:hypothetical protein
LGWSCGKTERVTRRLKGDADAEYDQESPQVLSKEEVPERLQS